jgi:hypothetical protein
MEYQESDPAAIQGHPSLISAIILLTLAVGPLAPTWRKSYANIDSNYFI